MAALDSLTVLNNLLEEWSTENYTAGFATSNPIPNLTKLAELVEHETEAYYKMDPDPFDDRHPGRANPTCTLGHLFKALFKHEDFMNKFVNEYLADAHGNMELTTAAARLLYDVMPAIEKTDVFVDTEGLVEQLLQWAEKADEPLRSYATGLLAGAMELQDIASIYKEKNSALVPIMIQRLHRLQREMHEDFMKNDTSDAADKRNFFMFGSPNKTSSTAHLFTPPKTRRSRSPVKSPIKSPTKLCTKTQESTNISSEVKEKESALHETNKENSDLNNVKVTVPPNNTGLNDNISEVIKDNPETGEDGLVKELFPSFTEKTESDNKNNAEKGVENKSEINGAAHNKDMNGASVDTDSKKVDFSSSQTPCCSTDTAATNGNDKKDSSDVQKTDYDSEDEMKKSEDITVEDRRARLKRTLSPSFYSEDVYRLKKQRAVGVNYVDTSNSNIMVSDVSNSSWAEIEPYVIGSYSLEPLTLGMKQRLVLQYLTPMGEYQELISAAFENQAMDLIFYYINLKYNKDVRLAFEALKYLAVLLCHKKFAIDFLQRGGVQKLLDVYRPSIAATGVSLCLYYLSYFEDAMERVCLLSDHILTTLVNYILWLLECSHDSSRCHAAMFFTQAFPFLVILNRFDTHDGLRRLYNVISTLGILNIESSGNINEDQTFTQRQAARHVCVALKRYFESHLVLKVNELKRSHARTEGGSPQHETPAYKALKISPEMVQENIEILMELMPVRQQWQPEATFHKLGGITLLSQLVAMAPEWSNYTGKPETIKGALDVISICCVTPKSQLALLGSVPLPDNVTTPTISVFIGLAEGEVMTDSDVQRSALNVIINCVCGPLERLGGGVGRYMGTGSKKKINWKLGEDVLSKMWNGVRENNGIMGLLKLLSIKTPITDADSIRGLACKALTGMARSETVRQIISKLPLFSNGQLQLLMKEPVLQDKQQEHVKFCRYSTELIEKVSGKQTQKYSDASLEDIRKADIVAQSKVIFHEKELLQLMYDHLQSKGFNESAEALQKEACLPRCVTPPNILPATPHVFGPSSSIGASPSLFLSPPSSVSGSRTLVNRSISHPHSIPDTPSSSSQFSGAAATVGLSSISASSASSFMMGSLPSINPGPQSSFSIPGASSLSGGSTPNTPGQPLRFSISRQLQQQQQQHATPPSSSTSLRSQPRCKYIKDQDRSLFSPALRKGLLQRPQNVDYEISLDKIVTEYLRKQHALCRNPVVTCPPMSLFHPHRCPEPRGKSCAPLSFTSRTTRKMIEPKYGGMDGCKLDRKFIYSRFKPIRTLKEQEDDGFSCCTFATTQQYLMLGTYAGNLKLINTQNGEETGSFHCHSSPVTHCEHSKDGKLVITASSYGIMYSSALWSWGSETLDNVFNFEDHHIEFSRHVQDRLVGTKDETANIYDIVTGQKILKLYDADKANNYKANRAIYNPTDDLVLNDGVLWDVRSGKSIHKFDKFNQYISGVFHPQGLEIIINSEVWDIRSFRLLHTVAALDQCQICFNHMGDIMYATRIDEELDVESDRHNPYGSTFRTFDATNYSLIATMDVKSRSISDLCTDSLDSYLAVVENQQSADIGAEENICRLYEIGKRKDDEDQGQEEEEEEPANEDDDDDDDDEDDDDIDDDLLFAEEEEGGDEDNSNDNEDDEDADSADINDGGDDDDDDDEDIVLEIGTDDESDNDSDDDDFDIEGAYFELGDL